ncbi:CD276 antigen-like [Polyodon spathula]|nr:CD276 antigen-like [Polyodon spathula]
MQLLILVLLLHAVLTAYSANASSTGQVPLKKPSHSVGLIEGQKFEANCSLSGITAPPEGLLIAWNWKVGNEYPVRLANHFSDNTQETVKYSASQFRGRLWVHLEKSSCCILTIKPVRTSDSGEYQCLINGNQELLLDLHVDKPFRNIEISYEPKNVTEGEEVTVTCTADGGYPQPDVQWVSEGQKVTREAKTTMTRSSDGSFNVRTILRKDAKVGVRYSCSIWDRFTEKLLLEFVEPIPGPKVKTPLKEVTGILGKNVVLKCRLSLPHNNSDIMKELSIIWLVHDPTGTEKIIHEVIQGDRTLSSAKYFQRTKNFWNTFVSQGIADLEIQAVTVEDMGNYICRIKKGTELIGENFVELKVTSPYSKPVITYVRRDIHQQQVLHLLCLTQGGFPIGDIQWLGPGQKDLTDQSESHVKVTSDGMYKMVSDLKIVVDVDDTYTCVVSNPWLENKETEVITFVNKNR